jgi:hypothetical protein
LALTVSLLTCAVVGAQTRPATVDGGTLAPTPEWGTSSMTVYTALSADCSTVDPNDEWGYVPSSLARFMTQWGGEDSGFLCPLHLPTGGKVVQIWPEGLNGDAQGTLTFTLYRAKYNQLGETLVQLVIPPFVIPPAYSIEPFTVKNLDEKYWIHVRTFDPTPWDGNVQFAAVRVFYQRQVSPGPATATFGDVPTTHSQFKFIEALVAAGITGGCGNGNFCPDQLVKRGQMAVFLATALGLHYPN